MFLKLLQNYYLQIPRIFSKMLYASTLTKVANKIIVPAIQKVHEKKNGRYFNKVRLFIVYYPGIEMCIRDSF